MTRMGRTSGIASERYEEIKEIIADMFEDLGYTEIPVNVFELCHKLDIDLIRYSSLTPNCVEYSMQFSNDGFNLFNVNVLRYQIFYNDQMPPERITFTIMHEIGHIMLEHEEHTEENEQEANFYAKTALVPLGLISKLNLKTSSDIADTFGIRFEFARNIVSHFNKTMIYPSIFEKEENSRLVQLFSKEYDKEVS